MPTPAQHPGLSPTPLPVVQLLYSRALTPHIRSRMLFVYLCRGLLLYSIGPPIRISYLERASDSYLLVQRQVTFLYPVCYPPKVSNRVLFARILRTSIFLMTAGILKGCPLLRMRRGAGCWQPKPRLSPAATSNRLRRLQFFLHVYFERVFS